MDDLHASYSRSGFGEALGFGDRPAVLVVDVIRAYLEPSSPLYAGVEDAVTAAARVVDASEVPGPV